MRILFTNDDGVQARILSEDITIVATLEEQSGKGHSLTLTEPVPLSPCAASASANSPSPARRPTR